MKMLNIKGTEYAPVNERIKIFKRDYKNYKLTTDIVQLDDSVVIMKSTILNEKNEPVADGIAFEKKDSSFINKTSYIENCQTSAVGRALAFLGIGVDGSISSYEETLNAINQQDAKTTSIPPKPGKVATMEPAKAPASKPAKDKTKMNDNQLEIFRLAKEKDIPIEKIEGLAKKFGAQSIKKMSTAITNYVLNMMRDYNHMQLKLLIFGSDKERHPTQLIEEVERKYNNSYSNVTDEQIQDELVFMGYYNDERK